MQDGMLQPQGEGQTETKEASRAGGSSQQAAAMGAAQQGGSQAAADPCAASNAR